MDPNGHGPCTYAFREVGPEMQFQTLRRKKPRPSCGQKGMQASVTGPLRNGGTAHRHAMLA